MYNPSLSQEPRFEPAAVIPVKEDSSLVDWLKATNRLIPREKTEEEELVSAEEVDLVDIMENDDGIVDYDDDDDFDLEDDD